MKRLIFFSYMMSVAWMTVGQIPLGFKAGLNTNRIVVRDSPERYNDNSDAELSFHLGVYTKIKLSNKFKLLPEAQFIQKQTSYDDPKIRLSYVEVPLLISYQPVRSVNIETGPSICFKVATNIFKDSYDKIDAGIVGGLRINLTSNWSVVGRYYLGLSPIEKLYFAGPLVSDPVEVVKMYNETFQFSIAYYLKGMDN